MTAEAPIQIDLSQDNSWDKVDDSLLTQDDKNRLKEHFTEEYEGIIYLTKQEIADLKNILDSGSVDSSGFIDGAIDKTRMGEFIEEQKLEGLSSSDIVSGVENNLFTPELLDQLDALSKVALFEDNGLFDGLILSDTAKDHVSVSLTFAILEQIKKQPEILQGLKDNSPDAILGVITQFNTTFTQLGDIIRANEALGESFIAGNGNKNGVFMETDTGKDFFEGILSGDITKENIIVEISEHNTENSILPIIGNTVALEEMIETGSLTQEQLVTLLTQVDPNVAPPANATPEEKKSWLESLKEKGGIGAIFAAILEALKGFIPSGMLEDDGNTDSSVPKDNPDEAQEIAPTRVNTLRTSLLSRLSEGSLSDIKDEGIKAFLETEGNMEKFLTTMRDIPTNDGQNTLEEKINNMLFSNIESEETDKFTAFIKAGSLNLIRNTDGTFNGENFLLAATSYKNYRIANNNSDSIITFEEFFTNSNE